MKEKTDKLITWVALGIAVLASILAVVFALNTDTNGAAYGMAYGITLAFVVLSVLAILGFACMSFANKFKEDRKGAIKTLIIIGVAIVVILLSFLLASGTDVPAALLDKNNLTESTSRWIGAACILVYILVIAAAVAIVYVECSKLIKKK